MSWLEVLESPNHPSGFALKDLKDAMYFPWLVPHDADDKLRNWGITGRTKPLIGEVMLVTARDNHDGELWQVLANARPENVVPFRSDQRENYDRLMQLASKALSAVVHPGLLDRPGDWTALRVPMDPDAERSKDIGGRSFDLPLAMSAASLLVGIPLPRDVVATGQLDDSGALEPIDGLESKILAVAQFAPGVRRFYVPQANQVDAKSIVKKHNIKNLKVVGFPSLEDVLGELFPERNILIALGELSDKDADALADELFGRLLRANSRIQCWKAVEATAVELQRRINARIPSARGLQAAPTNGLDGPEDNEFLSNKLRLVAGVAHRHAGGLAVLIKEEEKDLFDKLGYVHRLSLQAQVVQSYTDSGKSPIELQTQIDEAREMLETPCGNARFPQHLQLMGACGRGLAALRKYNEAADFLQKACLGWQALYEEGQASRPLCELLRVIAVRNDDSAPKQLSEWIQWAETHGVVADPKNLPFFRMAAASSLALVGNYTGALGWIAPLSADWSLAPQWMYPQRQRWLARIYDGLGQRNLSQVLRGTISCDDDQTCLCALDDALATNSGVSSAVDNLLGEARKPRPGGWGAIMLRLHGLLVKAGLQGRTLAQHLADEFPY